MSEDPTPPTPDPADALRHQLAQANQRLIHAELKSHAIRAGIIDLDCLKLLDQATLSLDENGTLPAGSEAIATLKRDKPWLFTNPNSGHPAPPPQPEPAKPRMARDMTHREWQAARDRLTRGR